MSSFFLSTTTSQLFLFYVVLLVFFFYKKITQNHTYARHLTRSHHSYSTTRQKFIIHRSFTSAAPVLQLTFVMWYEQGETKKEKIVWNVLRIILILSCCYEIWQNYISLTDTIVMVGSNDTIIFRNVDSDLITSKITFSKYKQEDLYYDCVS